MAVGIFFHLSMALYVLSYFLLTQIFTNWCCRLTLAYAFWFVYDKDTSSRGGRPIQWVRRLNCFRRLAGYYPMTLEKTEELDPNAKYVFGYHPHGGSAMGSAVMFATEAVDISRIFPGLRFHLLSHSLLHVVPYVRELLAAIGVCDVGWRSIDYVLRDVGHAAVIVVGGAREALMSDFDKTFIVLKNRKGFVRMAIRHVPVYAFGETRLFKVHMQVFPWTKLNRLQRIYKWLCSYPPLIVSGVGLLQHPFRVPINAIVGKPILVVKQDDPSDDTISRIHAQYMHELEKIYEDNKARFGYFTDWCCRLTLAYAFWFHYDNETNNSGGRPNQWIRQWQCFRRFAASRSLTLEKTVDLDPGQSYIFGYHPHGAIPFGTLMFATDAVDVSRTFPGLCFHVLTLKGMHVTPLLREFVAALGMSKVTGESIDNILQQPGHVAVIVVGGVREITMSDPDKTYLFVKSRKGFVRRAIKNGAHLVPVFSFGETRVAKLHTQIFPWTKLTRFQRLFKWFFSSPPPSSFSFIKPPHRVPIHAIVGRPIFVEQNDHPSDEVVDRIHAQYIDDLERIYEDNKARFGVESSNRIIFVE
ncbi:putative 2-acylglycerol O-acyltransferase 1 [Hypsibius exemplaris]|uniref:diacylglycerol O-acyltransferase n=1 Tax=Hypsibius exemplaris TaxID=2072580 RepID=A0A1W0WJ91_HYPEX|nr:putative 2-acylglycerol O-acyltransferase 1 [Hypsibius exemplaris]